MCVCRRLHVAIKQHSLYNTIVLQSPVSVAKLIKNLENKPSMSTECLILENNLGPSFDLVTVLNLFPNVRTIYLGTKIRVYNFDWIQSYKRLEHIFEGCKNSNNDDSSVMTVDSTFRTSISDSSIYNTSDDDSSGNDSDESVSSTRQHRLRRRLLSPAYQNLTSYFLSTSGLPRLKSLAVSIYPMSGKQFVHLLSNAPNLSSLTLNEFTITVDRLELLHDTLPSLRQLSILEGIVSEGLAVSHPIKPAKLVRRAFFKIHRGKLLTKSRLLQYMRLKYTRLVDFTLQNILNRENHLNIVNDEFDFFVDAVLPLLANFGPQLKRLTLRLPLLDPTDMMIMIKANYQLDHLGLETSHSTDIVAECLPVLKPLLSLQSLCLYEPECDDKFAFLKPLEHLKVLKIYRPTPDQFKVNHLLENLNPGIVSLSLGDCWILHNVNPHEHFKMLTELTLTKVILAAGIDIFISIWFPSLRHLGFHDCIFPNKYFLLPCIQLETLTVTDHTMCMHEYVLVKSYLDERVVFADSCPLRRQRYFSKNGPAFSSLSPFPPTLACPQCREPRLVISLASVKDINVSIPRAEALSHSLIDG
jgi:hypothetical protein